MGHQDSFLASLSGSEAPLVRKHLYRVVKFTVDEVCRLFKLAGMHEDVVKKKLFPLSLKGKELTWSRLCDDIASWNYN